jgi:hypothetical protein
MNIEDIKVDRWYYATKDLTSAEPLRPARVVGKLNDEKLILVAFQGTSWRLDVVPPYSVIDKCKDPNNLRRFINLLRRIKTWIVSHS